MLSFKTSDITLDGRHTISTWPHPQGQTRKAYCFNMATSSGVHQRHCRQSDYSSCFSGAIPHGFWESISYWDQGSLIALRCPVSKSQEPSCLCLPCASIASAHNCACLFGLGFVFHKGSGIKFRYSCLQSKSPLTESLPSLDICIS